MIICSCNVISDHDIRGAASTDDALCSAAQVYDCLGCAVRCGRCSQSVRRILEERPARDTRCSRDRRRSRPHPVEAGANGLKVLEYNEVMPDFKASHATRLIARASVSQGFD